MNLQECLEEYKDLTLKLIESVQASEELTLLIEKRDNTLKRINEIKFEDDELKRILSSLKILELDDELIDLVSKEKVATKEKLDVLKKSRTARKNYTSMPNNPVIFSTKL
ncbi:MAG: flagellar protein FliT [Clostridium beijerinckii]|uniref:flagellar protein FliT n=1 Tax=Clostridium beijerinckii TaxID=1520 RepID=UPI001494DD81|nr:flagellar protein FliT [Clostridium beijerinckii]MCI1477733.1 flagellar protein FliT [Clostridium beijerinckii]MCI1577951.1 flagellar protein FliT [Clostridium beijerinckii]MCI1583132.1 flagellar protein FliT [Clostridium beijerinckii]MCI1620638.1 flagellar protein FliT [Clostridium beijerinckii]NOW87875.1 hypothetical protein [Clostridium beijerinckii]